ncbi:MAG: hypothetical protein Tsb0034_08890 [Ekhidna sp.]
MFVTDYILNHDPGYFKERLAKESVSKLFAFGSSLHSNNPKDIDLLIEIEGNDPLIKGESLINLWDFFEKYFKRKVDLLTPSCLKNPYLRDEIESSKQLIYAKGQQEVFA